MKPVHRLEEYFAEMAGATKSDAAVSDLVSLRKHASRDKVQQLIGKRENIPPLSELLEIPVRVLTAWYDDGIGKAHKKYLDRFCGHFGIKDRKQDLWGGIDGPKKQASPAMHEALDEALNSQYADFVKMVVMWAQAAQAR